MSNPLFLSDSLQTWGEPSKSAKSDKIKQKPDEYLYAAARFRTKAVRMLTPDALAKLGEGGSVEELLRQLSERGVEITMGADGHLAVEEALERFFDECITEVEKNVPDSRWVALLRYPYDAHNIKTILKCRVREKDPSSLLIPLGTVSPDRAVEAMRTEQYGVFPKAMADAIGKAAETYAQTGDPQLIDAIIDSACYADLLTLADNYPQALFGKVIRTKIDMTNLITAIRIGRMKGMSVDYCLRHLIPGGTLFEEFFKESFGAGEDAMLLAASKMGYPTLAKAVGADLRLSALEKLCEEPVAQLTRYTAGEPMDVKVVYGYLCDRDKEIKNIRILLAAMQAGRTPAQIRELLRA